MEGIGRENCHMECGAAQAQKQLDQIQGLCDGIHADILVLTETDKRLHPDYAFCCETTSLMGDKTIPYAVTENRVSLYTNYPVVRLHQTYDSRTALCAELKTEKGNLLVYGTIIGTLGNRHSSFMEQLHRQCDDIRRLSELGDGICVCGDFNCSFSDNYCFTQAARTTLLDLFRDTGLTLLTERQTECIDHIAVSSSMVTEYSGRFYTPIPEIGNHRSDMKETAIPF